MSEVPIMPEPRERESNVVTRVAKRVGKFLEQTYTRHGVLAKDIEKAKKLTEGMTFYTRRTELARLTKRAESQATWKVIRNWVLTGAGLALGGAILANPAGAWAAITETAGAAVAKLTALKTTLFASGVPLGERIKTAFDMIVGGGSMRAPRPRIGRYIR